MERKYNMCDVALPAMSGRALATLVSAEVVMTGGDTTVTHGSILPGAALPTPDMPGPALASNIGAEEMEASSTWSDRIQVNSKSCVSIP